MKSSLAIASLQPLARTFRVKLTCDPYGRTEKTIKTVTMAAKYLAVEFPDHNPAWMTAVNELERAAVDVMGVGRATQAFEQLLIQENRLIGE